MNASLPLRLASSNDVDTLVAIDDDACSLFSRVGLHFDIGPDHPFARAEYARWRAAVEAERAWVALGVDADPVGFVLVGEVDGAAHLEQLSVRCASMRRGIGRQLVRRAIAWAGERELWLTTYAHVPWNRPFYEQEGFRMVAERACGPEIQAILEEQRRWLPAPAERIAMRRTSDAGELYASSGTR
jgi:GNAT superfamily N-acetyltransferase